MLLFKGLGLRWFICAIWPLILLLSTGCQTASGPLGPIGSDWTVQEGQALWRPRRGLPELGGELVVARHTNGSCLVRFDKTPLNLVLAQTTRTNWVIQFPPRQMSFGGRHAPSTRFAWLYLHCLLAGEKLPARFRGEHRPDGHWRLENPRSGETLEGYLTP
jgi:hypothetical protein